MGVAQPHAFSTHQRYFYFTNDKVPLLVWSLIFVHQILRVWREVVLTSRNLSYSFTRSCLDFVKLSLIDLFSAITIVPSSDKSRSIYCLMHSISGLLGGCLLLGKFSITMHHPRCGLGAQRPTARLALSVVIFGDSLIV